MIRRSNSTWIGLANLSYRVGIWAGIVLFMGLFSFALVDALIGISEANAYFSVSEKFLDLLAIVFLSCIIVVWIRAWGILSES